MKKMYFGKFCILLAAIFMVISPLAAFADDIVLICNKSVAAGTVSKDDLSRIYLGQKNLWENGSKIEPVIFQGDITDTFLTGYVGKNAMTFGNYWKKMLFSGKGSGPKQFAKPKEVVDFVASTQGAIGFVPSGTNTDAVKIISVSN